VRESTEADERARSKAALEHAREVAERERKGDEEAHTTEIEHLKSKYENKIRMLVEQHKDGETIDALMKQVGESAQQVKDLQGLLGKERQGFLDEKESAYRARNVLLQEKEDRLAHQSAVLDQEKAKLASLQVMT